MTKLELTKKYAEIQKITKVQASKDIGVLFGIITEALKEDRVVVLPLIGKLKIVKTSAREGVSMVTGKATPWYKKAGEKIKLVTSKKGKELVESVE